LDSAVSGYGPLEGFVKAIIKLVVASKQRFFRGFSSYKLFNEGLAQ